MSASSSAAWVNLSFGEGNVDHHVDVFAIRAPPGALTNARQSPISASGRADGLLSRDVEPGFAHNDPHMAGRRKGLHIIWNSRRMAIPRCLRENVERDFQVTATVALWWRQPTPCEVYLQGRQHQRRHREVPIPLPPELDEFALVAVLQMQIVRPLGSNSALPSGVAAVWTVVVP